jgi:cytosine/adenosine deaminase-related metal-dependent hydrolase
VYRPVRFPLTDVRRGAAPDDAAFDRRRHVLISKQPGSDAVKLVHVRGARALAWFKAGYRADAADAAGAADAEARRRAPQATVPSIGQVFLAQELRPGATGVS